MFETVLESDDESVEEIGFEKTNSTSNTIGTALLEDLNKLAKKKKIHYTLELKQYGLYVLLLAGNVLYDNLRRNLRLPSRSTELKYFATLEDLDFKEAVLRATEIFQYLSKNKYPLCGWGSEDATKILPGVRYCSKTNKMVGLVGPLNHGSGLPDVSKFEFNSIDESYGVYHSYPKAEYVNVQMFQPITNKAMPFVLNMYGTDNKFNHQHVTNRWIHTKNALNSFGIQLLGNYQLNIFNFRKLTK